MPKRVKKFWRCRYCLYKNWAGNRACVSCGKDQQTGIQTREVKKDD